jgi:hypothetical protein
MSLIIIGAILTLASLVISYFLTNRSPWRKIVLIVGIAGALLTCVQGYRNLRRADNFQRQLAEERAEAQKVRERISPRSLTDKQVVEVADSLRKYAGQSVSILTYWDNAECAALARRIFETLQSANWNVPSRLPGPFRQYRLSRGPAAGEPLITGLIGIEVVVNSPPENTKNAAKALVDALNRATIGAKEQYVQTTWSSDHITLLIGTRPDFP